jgi:hypothetical protein
LGASASSQVWKLFKSGRDRSVSVRRNTSFAIG